MQPTQVVWLINHDLAASVFMFPYKFSRVLLVF